MADAAIGAAAGPKHSFGHLARRSMTDLTKPPPASMAEAPQTSTPTTAARSSGSAAGLFADEAFEERAAIMEFDGGMTREDAEEAARLIYPFVPRG